MTTEERLIRALEGMVVAYDNLVSDTDGRYPQPDPGCIECTQGCTPNNLNLGPCAYHHARTLLRIIKSGPTTNATPPQAMGVASDRWKDPLGLL